jgi:ferredoxin
MKVITHTERCIASGACVLASPAVFDQDEDGIVMLLDDSPAESEHESVRPGLSGHGHRTSVIA